jgi:hypothetical protein
MTVFRYVSAQSPIALPMVAILLLLSRFFHFLLLYSSAICLDNLSISALWLFEDYDVEVFVTHRHIIDWLYFYSHLPLTPFFKAHMVQSPFAPCALATSASGSSQHCAPHSGHLVIFQSLRPVGTFTFSGIQ